MPNQASGENKLSSLNLPHILCNKPKSLNHLKYFKPATVINFSMKSSESRTAM